VRIFEELRALGHKGGYGALTAANACAGWGVIVARGRLKAKPERLSTPLVLRSVLSVLLDHGDGAMAADTRRKTSLTLDAAALDAARALGVNVSAVADAALRHAVAEARRRKWLEENAAAFAEQAA
jgi:antitoxin CcdA